ncbi:non-hydrolyzing UDP-N-acetylglucosamine 2-epimerase [Tepidicaulis sp.]|uniref:non-hydrolyzing UDP-N-acetylglucosamine 2-epimerase n=1 Tax=Tepidicaulis sp. TaxID=1920809 RepID=UPI003B5A798B
MLKIVSIVGARPQFIKAAVVSRAIFAESGLDEVMVHTGQHYDEGMSDIFFSELSIPAPAYNLAIGSGSHGRQTGRMLEGIEEILLKEKPDWVLVYGDTNSTLAGALAASKLLIPVAHVEAGLRSRNMRMPEEQNRIVSDHLSSLLMTPTLGANTNLEKEGIAASKIDCVGDVMYDASRFAAEAAAGRGKALLEKLGLKDGEYVLSTVHRAENTDDPARLRAILEGLAKVAGQLPVLLPLHPRTRNMVKGDAELGSFLAQLQIIDPVGYFDMASLEAGAALVATDSGGVQKEAYFHGKPCVTLRDETEWTELVELGWNIVQPPVSAEAVAGAILAGIGRLGQEGEQPYGAGDAGRRIVEALKRKSGA